MIRHFDERAVKDWLSLLPAASLARYVSISALADDLLAQPSSVSIDDVRVAVASMNSGYLQPLTKSRRRRTELAASITMYQQYLRTRSIEAVRPPGPSWVVPDAVGFSIEGRRRTMSHRRETLLAYFDDLSRVRSLESGRRRAVRRVRDLLLDMDPYPTWLFWYSASSVGQVRRASPETLQALNRATTSALNELGYVCTISTWEEQLGVVSRRFPIGVVTRHIQSRRCRGMVNRLEKSGIRTLGGLSVLSTDSLMFLSKVRIETIQGLAGALRDDHLRRGP